MKMNCDIWLCCVRVDIKSQKFKSNQYENDCLRRIINAENWHIGLRISWGFGMVVEKRGCERTARFLFLIFWTRYYYYYSMLMAGSCVQVSHFTYQWCGFMPKLSIFLCFISINGVIMQLLRVNACCFWLGQTKYEKQSLPLIASFVWGNAKSNST